MVVAVHGRPDDEGRAAEYVLGVDAARFAAHEDFLFEVAAWVRSQCAPDVGPRGTAVWGASLGGEFALAMGLRHPEVFGTVLCASPGGGFRPTGPLRGALPSVYLVAGDQEPFFADNARRWQDALRAAQARVVLRVRAGDHGGAFWYDELPRMLSWGLGPSPPALPAPAGDGAGDVAGDGAA